MHFSREKTFLKIKISSIGSVLIIGMFLSLIIPLGFANIYISTVTKDNLYQKFDRFRQETTAHVASALSDPVYYYSPNDGGKVVETLKQDSRVAKIYVYDTFNDLEFLEVKVPHREEGKLFENTDKIYKNNEEIGYVKISYNDNDLASFVKEQQVFFIKLFGLIFIVLFSVLVPLVYIKVLKPLKRLAIQAKQFQEGSLDKPFVWEKKDEIHIIGNILELARINTLEHLSELREISQKDKLTGLYNRHKTDEVLEYEKQLSDRYEHNFGVVLLDIDNFKNINDTYGHQSGDSVLRDIANILKNNCRKIDTVGRWGGEEFVVICPETDEEGLKSFAEKVLTLVSSSTFDIEEVQTTSAGLTLYEKGEDISKTISRADKALYQAKSTGKNRAVFL